jgi:hypothetical protein
MAAPSRSNRCGAFHLGAAFWFEGNDLPQFRPNDCHRARLDWFERPGFGAIDLQMGLERGIVE